MGFMWCYLPSDTSEVVQLSTAISALLLMQKSAVFTLDQRLLKFYNFFHISLVPD